ncbi:hypothetical protein DMC14_002445 [Metamycoplasma phocicerebrale]|uniref:Lipoprotein n=1 Tax=Metamycoplasma phocicerebrale TaxID=142649 RepID=A0A3Q9V8P5_9BACT|nr:hypothetical protein [Metamycoplasma phocicerebrale]AZZ65630.1 hypothetical protein DMC14_002445 [Metamycoplasma phocicerebrale]
MKKRFKLLLTGALPLSVLPVAPLVVACNNSSSKSKKETPGYQIGFLKEITSKNQIILSVINTYLEVFYDNEVKSVSKDNKDKLLYLIEKKDSQFHKDLYNLFKFYANAKLDSDPQFFWNLRQNFIKLNIDVSSYEPAAANLPTEDNFIFLMKNSKFLANNIRLEIEKLLISKIYLLKFRDEFKKLSVNDKGLDKWQVSLEKEMKKDSTSSLKKDTYDSLDFSASNLYLIKYLIESPLIEKWSFTDDQDMNLRIGKANVSNFNDFNTLASYNSSGKPKYDYNTVAKHPEYLLNTGESEGFDIKLLKAYKGILSNVETSGDLSNSLYAMRRQKSPVFGFIDPKTKRVYDQDHFKLSKILKQEDKLPALKASAQLKQKQGQEDKLKSITAKDIEFDGLNRDPKDEKLFTKTITVDSKQYTLEFKVRDTITFSGEILRVPMTLSVKELGARHFYDFNSELEYKSKAFIDQTEGKNYNLDKYPTFIDMIKDNKIDASYVVKIAPSYIKKTIKNLKGENEDKKVFTLEQTPWNSNEQQDILANTIVLNKGNTLFREVNKYILDHLGFKLENLNKTVLELFKTEGLL